MSSSQAKIRPEPVPYRLPELAPDAETQTPEPALPEEAHEDFQLLFVKQKGSDAVTTAHGRAERIEAEAEGLKEQAKKELDDAKAEAEGIRKQAYEEGYQQGVEEGKAAAAAQVTAALDNLMRTLKRLDSARAELLSDMEPELLAVVQAAFDRLCLSKEAIAPDLVRNLVKTAVTRLPESEEITVRVSPADLSLVSEYQPQLMEAMDGLGRVRVRVDESLHPGDCLVESSVAQVDATLATRRERVSKALENALRQGEPIPAAELSPAAGAPADPAPRAETDPAPEKAGDAPDMEEL